MCIQEIQIKCPHCHNSKVVKNKKKKIGRQNFLCKNCGKQFQQEYFYRGASPSVKAEVRSSLLHGSGIRGCNKVFRISPKCTLYLILKTGQSIKITPKQKRYHKGQIDEI